MKHTELPSGLPSGLSDLAPAKQFRPEIEGVRFVAALLVACYHLWTGRVSGGVDVFFTISGFLITTTLLHQLATSARVRPLAFLGRLALRLLPAALTTLVAVLVATVLLLPRMQWPDVGHEVRASATYVQNWYLAATSTDYLDRWDEKTPVQHFWALSLQGQLYLLWIAVFAFLVLIARRVPGRAPVVLGCGLGLVFATSLAFSVWFTERNQPVAYFATPARAWEFALGGLAALALRHPLSTSSLLRWALGWMGLATLLSTGLVLHVGTVFPGYAALMPTAAALMILFSARSGYRAGADRLLSWRPLVWLGGISYGIYLWHYPLLRFHRSVTESRTTGLLDGVAIIGVAVLLAWLVQVLVERPVRALAARSTSARRLVVGGLLVLAGAVAATATVLTADPADPRQAVAVRQIENRLVEHAYDLPPCTGALAGPPTSAGACSEHPPSTLTPPPELVAQTQKALPCATVLASAAVTVCSGGTTDPRPRATVMLIGDSHSLVTRPALELVARHNGWRLLFSWHHGCQTASRPKTGTTGEQCARWLAGVTDYLREHPVDVLFDIQASGKDLVGDHGPDKVASYVESYREQWRRYAGSIQQLVVIRDTPKMESSVLTCIARHGAAGAAAHCSRPRAQALRTDYAALAAATDGDAATAVADLSDTFCDRTRCYPVIGGFIAYRDGVHLHTMFARTLAPLLDGAIRNAVPGTVRDLLFAAPAAPDTGGGGATW